MHTDGFDFGEHVPLEWRLALVGALVAVPLTFGLYWLGGAGESLSANPVAVGGFVAGYLASCEGGRAGRTGLRAGAIAGLPAAAWIAPAALDTVATFADAWSSWLAASLVGVLFLGIVLGLAALVGLVGGVAGGWVARKRGRSGTRARSC